MRLVSPTAALLVALVVFGLSVPVRWATPRSSVAEAAEDGQRTPPDIRTPARQCPSGVIHHHHCVCKADGSRVQGADQCCSGSTRDDGVCCGELNGSCFQSGCCGAGVCDVVTCVPCLQEGESSENSSDCCSLAMDDDGVCCGKSGESCDQSQCCAGDDLCHDDLCVACLPEGASPDSPAQCCSLTAENDKCCGELGNSCAASGCCSEGHVCHQGNCVDCLVEGTSTVDGDLCCSALAVDNVCCGENGDTCANSLCCGDGGLCSSGACVRCIDVGEETPNESACCTHAAADGHCCVASGDVCLGDDCCPGTFCENSICVGCRSTGAHCTDTSECCAGECCNGTCQVNFNDKSNCGSCGNACQSFERCQDGQCGQLCIDLTSCTPNLPPVDDIFCPEPTPYCTGFCSFDKRYLICCGEVPGKPGMFGTTCGDGTCCYGTCDFQQRVCMP